jgi:polysaccharide biosynthesis transport protein
VTRRDRTWPLLWRHRWLIAGITLLVAGTTAVISKTQTPIYQSSAALVVNQPETQQSFDTVRANETYARTLARLVRSVEVAERVVQRLPQSSGLDLQPRAALSKMDFAQVNETQLLEITAEDPVPARAQLLAQTWADTFVEYASTTLKDTLPGASVTVADPAPLPPQPVRPKPTLYTAVAFVLGLAAALAFVLVRDRLDTRIHEPDGLTEEFGLPVLATVPRKGRSVNSHERFEEGIRVLRTSLQFATELPLRAIAVTSSGEGEGKSTVTAELARSFALLALTDQAVLAVDADLRRPTLHLKCGFDDSKRGPRGLTTYLLGEARFDSCVLDTELASLRVMPAGALHPNPSTMLGFAASREALGQLRTRAEVVIVDTPPVAAGADASIVATEVDGVVIVVDLAKSRRDDLRVAIEQMRRVNALVLGFVVNRVTTTDRTAAGYYYTAAATESKDGGGPLGLLRRGRRHAPVEAPAGGAQPGGGAGQDEERGVHDLHLVLRQGEGLEQVAGEGGGDADREREGLRPAPAQLSHEVPRDPGDPREPRQEP